MAFESLESLNVELAMLLWVHFLPGVTFIALMISTKDFYFLEVIKVGSTSSFS
jgi:hypothetical protein